MDNPRSVSLILASTLLLTSCGTHNAAEEPSATIPPSQPSANGQVSPSVVESHGAAAPAGRELPTVDNTEIDRTDPSDVARKFILLTTMFNPGFVVDERNQVERGYPLTTTHYRDTNRPLDPFSGPTVRIRSWYNQATTDDDPVVHVSSTVQWLTRPQMPSPDADKAVRRLRSIQTPETESGRKLDERTLDYKLTLLKQKDGTWLVDAKSVTQVEDE